LEEKACLCAGSARSYELFYFGWGQLAASLLLECCMPGGIPAGLNNQIVIGIPQTFRDGAMQYTVRMQNSQAYERRVLEDFPIPENTVESPTVSMSAAGRGTALTVLALLLAWFVLADRARSFRRSLRFGPAQSLLNGLRALHSGAVGDYIVWIVTGVVALGSRSWRAFEHG
jgi:hypothetical protein